MLDIKTIENFKKFYEEHKSFIKERFVEASELQNQTRLLDIDFDLYEDLINSGYITLLSIFDDERFVGYISIAYSPSLTAKGRIDAVIDHLAFAEEDRNKGYAKEVISKIEELLKENDVDQLSLLLPATPMHKKFAEKLGFITMSCLHKKELI